MKYITKIAAPLFAIASLASLAACKKTGAPGSSGGGGNGSSYFFANTEWTGTDHTNSQEYDQPCYLRFNGDTTVSVYSTFAWILDNSLVLVDSTLGHVTKIDQAGDAATIEVSFAQTGDQQEYSITGGNTLTGGSISSSTAYTTNSFHPHLQRCPATMPSVSGPWSSKTITDPGPTQGMYAYPDLQTFSLNDDRTQTYYRAGRPVTYTPTDHDQILLETYTQRGPIVYMAGYDESRDRLNGYFGVLSPDGKSMFVNSHASYRLPNYIQTIYWYGPPGVTPIIFKQ